MPSARARVRCASGHGPDVASGHNVVIRRPAATVSLQLVTSVRSGNRQSSRCSGRVKPHPKGSAQALPGAAAGAGGAAGDIPVAGAAALLYIGCMTKPVEPRFQAAAEQLRQAGLRTTRQRLVLAEILFGQDRHCHVTAESLYNEAAERGSRLSLATVYNCLHQFTAAGLLRMVTVDAGRAYFDTNLAPHHHFYYERSGELQDIPEEQVAVARLPEAPAGAKIARVDVIVRLEQ